MPSSHSSFPARRRGAARLAALALTALVLGACSGNGGGVRADASAAATSGSAPAAASPSSPPLPMASASASAPGGAARWAGTKQFVQIRDVWARDGRTYLSVRAARKMSATGPIEAWEVVPGQGPYTTVSMAADGRVLLSVPLGDDSVPHAYSQAQFVSRWTAAPSYRHGLGYDLSFDANGEVTRAQSLYTP